MTSVHKFKSFFCTSGIHRFGVSDIVFRHQMWREGKSPWESHETNARSERQAWLVRRQGEAWSMMGKVLELLLLRRQAKRKEVSNGSNLHNRSIQCKLLLLNTNNVLYKWCLGCRSAEKLLMLVADHVNAVIMCDWWGEWEKKHILTPMIALRSAMLTCLDLSTAWATWCWCCKNRWGYTKLYSKDKKVSLLLTNKISQR